MKWLTGLFRKAAAIFSFIPQWVRHSFSLITYDRLIREGYRVNSAVSACVGRLAFSFPEAPLLAGHNEEGRFVPDYSHPIMKLISDPNPDMGEAELAQFAITYASTGGNCYFWKQRSASKKVIHLWPFHDGQMSPVPGHRVSEGFVSHYEFDPGDGKKIPIPKEDVIHWKWMVDPLQPWKGIGAIELSAREVDKDNEASSYIFSLLKNNAVPSVVITKAENDDDTTQEELDRMGRLWVQKHRRGEPAFIGHDMKVEQMGFDLHKLAADTLADIPESRIAANFHVPPSVAGLNVGIKRSDYGDTAARRAFTETTLIPLWRSLSSELLKGLRDDFKLPPNFTLQHDLRRVGALQEEESKKWERLGLMFDRGGITRKMLKEMLGLKPEPGDNVYKVSLATEFIPADGDGQVVRTEPQKQAWRRAETKAQRRSVSKSLLDIRRKLAPKMTTDVNAYFKELAGRVVERAGSGKQLAVSNERKSDLPDSEDLITAEDRKELETLVKRFYVEVARLSWDTWNLALGVDLAFDLTDPAVTRILGMAGRHAEDIQGETLQALRDALRYGSDNGWGIDQLVRGDETQPGLRDIIEETYKNRARAVAISELGQAQNTATAERYRSAGVAKVEILDGGDDDSAPACNLANGQIWTVDLFERNTLQHPNCSRAGAPYFGDEEAVTEWLYAFGERG